MRDLYKGRTTSLAIFGFAASMAMAPFAMAQNAPGPAPGPAHPAEHKPVVNQHVNKTVNVDKTVHANEHVNKTVVTHHVVARPVVGHPVVGHPVVGRPVVEHPVVGHPVVGHPVGGGPIVGGPIVNRPASGLRWARGARFEGERRPFTDWGRYHLRQPPAGYEWVQDDDELVLINIGTGFIDDTFVITIP